MENPSRKKKSQQQIPFSEFFRFFRSNPNKSQNRRRRRRRRRISNPNQQQQQQQLVPSESFKLQRRHEASNQTHTTSEKNKNWVADFPTTQFSKCSFLCENIRECHFRQHPISFPSLRCPSSLECNFSREFQEKVLSTSYR